MYGYSLCVELLIDHIPTGRRKLFTQQVPAAILAMMEERDGLCKHDLASSRLSIMNDEITKLWRTIKGIDCTSKQTEENEGISCTSPKLIANSFNRQFITSNLDKHSSSRRARQVSKDVNRMSLEEAELFTSAIKICRNIRAFGPDSLSIFHLMNL